MEKLPYLDNISFLFIPFSFDRSDQYGDFCNTISCADAWSAVNDKLLYFHKYVSDRLAGDIEKNRVCRHYLLKPQAAEAAGIILNTQWYHTGNKTFQGQKGVIFDFRVLDIHLFCFRSSVCILAFQLQFADNDPRRIAAAQYYLRRTSETKIYPKTEKPLRASDGFILMDLVKGFFSPYQKNFGIDYFFYAAPKTEKANFLTYVDVSSLDQHRENLYYLKWCYHDGFQYDDIADNADTENYLAARDIFWGISSNAAACLVCRELGRRGFIEHSFQKNFMTQYLFTYVLLLHQKYVMYLHLTKLSVDLDNELVQMEEYKNSLYEFEKDFMYSHITEVPQYQQFYEHVSQVFALDQLFRDVQEPITQLADLRRQAEEEAQRKYDNRINTALTTLSLLTVVSALTDASGITSNLDWLISPVISRSIQIIMLVIVAASSILMLLRLFRLRKK